MYLLYKPLIVCVDRNQAQMNSISKNFPGVNIVHCWIHIKRNLLKYFSKDSIVYKLFISVIYNLLDENLFEQYIKVIIKNNSTDNLSYITQKEEKEMSENPIPSGCRKNENFIDENSEGIGRLFISKTKTIENFSDILIQKQVDEFRTDKGIGCLSLLLDSKEKWFPSYMKKLGFYRDNQNNIIEGTFGNLKEMTQHKKLLFYELNNKLKGWSLYKMNKRYNVEIPEELMKLTEEEFVSITPLGKLILLEQYLLFKNKK